MTGYGKSQGVFEDKKIQVEIKSLNSKQADIYAKIPQVYKSHEIKFRKQITQKLSRGKIELYFNIENSAKENEVKINLDIVNQYLEQLNKINAEGDRLSIAMRLPDVLLSDKKEINEDEFSFIENLIHTACDDLTEYRLTEGKRTETELLNYISTIENLLIKVEPFEEVRIQNIKNRILTQLESSIENQKIDKDRFEQELIFYIEKLDINEEKVRLKSNCTLFREVAANNESAKGKKLGFVCQEIGREINTLGSKANHAEIQKIVIQMKDELEKIKEQILNIL